LLQSREVLAHPPPPAPMCNTSEIAEMWIVQAEQSLHMNDAALRDGEKFLAGHPASMYAPMIKSAMERIIDEKRAVFEGEQEVAAEVNKMNPAQRNDLCQVGLVYNKNHQVREARRLLDACLAGARSVFPRKATLQLLVTICAQSGDYNAARGYMARLEQEDKKTWDGLKQWMNTWPSE
jgi:hypothetical protein